MGKSKRYSGKKLKTLKKIVAGIFIYWIAFVTTMIVIFCVKNAVPDTLIQYALGGGAVELLATAVIEILKPKFESHKEVESDGDNEDS